MPGGVLCSEASVFSVGLTIDWCAFTGGILFRFLCLVCFHSVVFVHAHGTFRQGHPPGVRGILTARMPMKRLVRVDFCWHLGLGNCRTHLDRERRLYDCGMLPHTVSLLPCPEDMKNIFHWQKFEITIARASSLTLHHSASVGSIPTLCVLTCSLYRSRACQLLGTATVDWHWQRSMGQARMFEDVIYIGTYQETTGVQVVQY